MSNKPRKKKKKPSKHNSACRPIEAFDNYVQFEKTIDDIIELLNAKLMDRNLSDSYPLNTEYSLALFSLSTFNKVRMLSKTTTL